MSTAQLEALGGERYRLSGVLDAVTAPRLLKQSEERFPSTEGAEIHLDLGGVSESDSSGLALLLEWLRGARQRKQSVRFANLPAQIAALARISEVEELLLSEGSPERQPREQSAANA